MKHNWTYKKLGEVTNKCENIRWNTIPKDSSFNYVDLTSVNRETCSIEDTQRISIADAPSRAKQIIHEGDVIFGTTRPLLRRVCRIPHEYDSQICSTGFCVLRPTSQVFTNWIFYNLCTDRFYEYVEPLQTGANYPAVSDDVVRKFRIPIPSLNEQQAIVRELDGINHLIDLQEEQLREYNRLAQSLFYTTFGDPLTNPKGWEVKKLGEVGQVITGNTPSTKDANNYASNDKCFFKPSDFDADQLTQLLESEYKISCYAYKHSRKLPKGSVLTTCIGIVGKVGILQANATCNQQINAIIPNELIESYYLGYAIMLIKTLLSEKANAPVVPLLNKSQFSAITIPVPPLALQQTFAAQIEVIEQQKALVRKSLDETRTLLAARMQYYFE